MKKIEIIWRELLHQALEKQNRQFTQKELAKDFKCSTSTVFQALKVPRKMGAIRVTGRFFVLEDPEKLLYHWASVRNLKKDIVYKIRVNLPVLEIESSLPAGTVFGAYTAARQILKDSPADYDKVYVYHQLPEKILKRFKTDKGQENLFILKSDPYLAKYAPVYGGTTPFSQTFVDLWNLPDWYAKEFIRPLKEKFDFLISLRIKNIS